ncbi:MAG: hypothetical protein HOP29_00190 [Phycisphaerales bacterium]|nr:hypothetical protein [Phycisphaerales bacterium]
MRRLVMLVVCGLSVAALSSAAFAGPDCAGCGKIEKAGEGFCGGCKHGKVFALEVNSQALYDLLAGSTEMTGKLKESKCPGCKKAATEGGACDHCKTFVAEGRTFQSKPAFVLAKGKLIAPDAVAGIESHCSTCAEAFKTGGFCDHCKEGFVGHHQYNSKESYDDAVAAYATVQAAVKDSAKCEGCATARLTDGTCKACNTAFKDGKPAKS